MEIQAVIFDMDGVICHTNPYHAEAFRVFFQKRNIHTSEQDFRDHLYGKANSYIFRHFLGDDYREEEFEAMEDEKEELFRKIYLPKIEPLSGFINFLNLISQANLKTGVATSAPRANLKMIVDSLRLDDKMNSFLASEDIIKHKPDPEIYLKTAKLLNITPKNCLVFEDSFSGISAANKAGMEVIGVLSTHTKEQLPLCKRYIDDFNDLSIDFLFECSL